MLTETITQMIREEMILAEVFNTKTKFEYHGTADYDKGLHNYSFNHNSNRFLVQIGHKQDGHAEVSFYDKTGNTQMSGEHPHDAVKIMAGVHNIVKHHVEQNPDLKGLQFSAVATDHGRVNLYRRLAKKFASGYEEKEKWGISKEFKMKLPKAETA